MEIERPRVCQILVAAILFSSARKLEPGKEKWPVVNLEKFPRKWPHKKTTTTTRRGGTGNIRGKINFSLLRIEKKRWRIQLANERATQLCSGQATPTFRV